MRYDDPEDTLGDRVPLGDVGEHRWAVRCGSVESVSAMTPGRNGISFHVRRYTPGVSWWRWRATSRHAEVVARVLTLRRRVGSRPRPVAPRKGTGRVTAADPALVNREAEQTTCPIGLRTLPGRNWDHRLALRAQPRVGGA